MSPLGGRAGHVRPELGATQSLGMGMGMGMGLGLGLGSGLGLGTCMFGCRTRSCSGTGLRAASAVIAGRRPFAAFLCWA